MPTLGKALQEKYLTPEQADEVYSSMTIDTASLTPEEVGSKRRVGDLAFQTGDVVNGRIRFNPEAVNLTVGGYLHEVDRLLKNINPASTLEAIAQAQVWREKDDLLSALVRMLLRFTLAGFDLTISYEQQDTTDNEKAEATKTSDTKGAVEVQNWLNRFNKKYKLKKVMHDLLQDYQVTDNMILYWRIDKPVPASSNGQVVSDIVAPVGDETLVPGLVQLSALNPADVYWDNSLGMDILKIRIPEAVRDRIRIAIEKDKDGRYGDVKTFDPLKGEAVQELMRAGIGEKWIIAYLENENYVELKREDGDNWLISTEQRMHCGLARPALSTCFKPLVIRSLLEDGEFTGAYMIKNLILLIQQGADIPNGPLAGQRNNWLTPEDAVALDKKFANTARAMRVVADHTVTIKFILPPDELFSVKKFESCESKIFNWAGVTIVLTTGEGGNYGSGFIGIKRTIASIEYVRDEGSILFRDFFDHPTIQPYIPSDRELDILCVFDENVLKEPKQLLDEIKFLVENAIEDSRTAAKELGRNPDRLRESKRRTRLENDSDGSWSPLQNDNQAGDTTVENPDPGGRPPNPDTTQSPYTRNQSPSR